MFKKKPTIKALAPLRSSDRRKIADEVILDLQIGKPPKEDATVEEKAVAASEHSALRNALMPENTLSAAFGTTAGPDLDPVKGTIYAGSQPSEEQRLLWIRIDGRMYPTVYTLWRNPGMLPLLHTHSDVVSKLQSGADLMTPGLANGPPFPSGATKDAMVAIASLESPSVPVAVGVCEIDVSDLQQVQGVKGHAVRIVHWAGDELWHWSASGKSGTPPPVDITGWLADDGTDGDDDGGVHVVEQQLQHLKVEVDIRDDEEDVDERELTGEEIDEAFFQAFLYGVRHAKLTNKNARNHGLNFPLNQSLVLSTLVQPFLPTFTVSQTQALQIKRTSWKNVKKFLKHLDKQKLIKAKDKDGSEVVVLDIHFEAAAFLDFKPYRLPKKNAGTGTGNDASHTAASSSSPNDPSIGQTLQRLELYRPPATLSPVFQGALSTFQSFFTATELRDPLTSYIERENLVDQTNKRLVLLDPILGIVFDTKSDVDRQVLAKGSVPRDALFDRVRQSCAPFWLVLRNSETMEKTKPKGGAPPKMTVLLETRGGKKTVTTVTGMEPFFIPPQPLADELRKTCAGSTSVEKTHGSSPKDPKMEVMVQGPQWKTVMEALRKRGMRREWVDFVNKSKGPAPPI